MINQKSIEKLQIIIKEDYGRNLNRTEILKDIDNLTGFFDILAKIQVRESLKNRNNNYANKSREN